MLKVAGFAAQLEHYERAIKIYEEVCNLIRIVLRSTIRLNEFQSHYHNAILDTDVPSTSNHKNILPLL